MEDGVGVDDAPVSAAPGCPGAPVELRGCGMVSAVVERSVVTARIVVVVVVLTGVVEGVFRGDEADTVVRVGACFVMLALDFALAAASTLDAVGAELAAALGGERGYAERTCTGRSSSCSGNAGRGALFREAGWADGRLLGSVGLGLLMTGDGAVMTAVAALRAGGLGAVGKAIASSSAVSAGSTGGDAGRMLEPWS